MVDSDDDILDDVVMGDDEQMDFLDVSDVEGDGKEVKAAEPESKSNEPKQTLPAQRSLSLLGRKRRSLRRSADSYEVLSQEPETFSQPLRTSDEMSSASQASGLSEAAEEERHRSQPLSDSEAASSLEPSADVALDARDGNAGDEEGAENDGDEAVIDIEGEDESLVGKEGGRDIDVSDLDTPSLTSMAEADLALPSDQEITLDGLDEDVDEVLVAASDEEGENELNEAEDEEADSEVNDGDDEEEEDDDDDEVPDEDLRQLVQCVRVVLTEGGESFACFVSPPLAADSVVEEKEREGVDAQDDDEEKEVVLFKDSLELFTAPLANFMVALQEELDMENDVTLFFPGLNLKFFSHLSFADKLSLLDLSYMHSQVCLQHGADTEVPLLTVEVTEEQTNFLARYNHLLSLSATAVVDESDNEAGDGVNSSSAVLGKRERDGRSDGNAEASKKVCR